VTCSFRRVVWHGISTDLGWSPCELLNCYSPNRIGRRSARDEMPLYFFIVRMADQEVNDPEGIRLPGDGNALQRAKRLVDEIRAGRAPVALGSTMIVKNAAGQTVFSIPI
jgi:hypothetical protein